MKREFQYTFLRSLLQTKVKIDRSDVTRGDLSLIVGKEFLFDSSTTPINSGVGA